ncbi:AMP-binding protein [uncultured Pseudoteredinibacter sp.]|uniref:AMP-binding protein n=1 Tax=uncultured Pseudoteredinibacter sp. TaxID=1641701 RepID=UPI0026265AC7|nr:AMP-binding protein [uncultured Pseudoteredinibacter sp.]
MNKPVLNSIAEVQAYEQTAIEERFNLNTNVYQALLSKAAEHPEREAFIYLPDIDIPTKQCTVSYGEFAKQLNQTAHFYQSLGLQSEESVVLLLPLLADSQALLWAAEAAGRACSINGFLEAHHIANIIKASKARIVVCPGPSYQDGIWEKLESIRPELSDDIVFVTLGDDKGDYQYPQAIADMPTNPIERDIAPQDIAAYFHTGGTTGEPKLAMHSHFNHLAQAYTVDTLLANGREHSRVALGMPIFHVLGALIVSLRNLLVGNTICMFHHMGFRHKKATENFWQIIEAMKINDVNAVPTIYSALVDLPVGDRDISSLQRMYTGASPGSLDQSLKIKEMCGQMPLNGFGMTEMCGVVSCYPNQDIVDGYAAGLRVPYMEVKTIEVDDEYNYIRDCNNGESGLLVFAGPTVMQGYLNQSHNSSSFIKNMPDGRKWLNSGDLGHVDKKGLFWINGRAKDLIIRGGHNIDPIIIEDAFYTHDSVETAAAVAQPDAYTIEMPAAYVCLKPSHNVNVEELLEHAQKNIPERAAIPKNIHIIDEMPVTAVGKIFKPALMCHSIEYVYQHQIQLLLKKENISDISAEVKAYCDKNKGTYAELHVRCCEADQAQAETLIRQALNKQPIAYTLLFTK